MCICHGTIGLRLRYCKRCDAQGVVFKALFASSKHKERFLVSRLWLNISHNAATHISLPKNWVKEAFSFSIDCFPNLPLTLSWRPATALTSDLAPIQHHIGVSVKNIKSYCASVCHTWINSPSRNKGCVTWTTRTLWPNQASNSEDSPWRSSYQEFVVTIKRMPESITFCEYICVADCLTVVK